MRTKLLVLGGLFSLLAITGCLGVSEESSHSPIPSGDIAWHETLESGLKAAKAENKLVFVDFSAEW